MIFLRLALVIPRLMVMIGAAAVIGVLGRLLPHSYPKAEPDDRTTEIRGDK